MKQKHLLDLLEDTRILSDAHAEQLLCPPVLVENVVGVLPELLHVGADEHLAKFYEVTVFFVVDLNDTPWVGTATNFTAICSLDNLV